MTDTLPDQASSSPSPVLRDWPAPHWFALGFGALIAAVFWPVLMGGESFYFRDFGGFGYPLAHYHRESFWRGEIPLWNPLACAGLPYAAQWNTLTLYPLSLIYLLLPLPWSLNFFMLVHLFLAGFGMYWLASIWTGNRFAGALAGLAYGFNGLLLNSLMWPNNLAAFGWMPWVILLARMGWQTGGPRFWLAMLAGALQMLAGAPEVILVTWIIAAGLFAADNHGLKAWRERAWAVARLAGIIAGIALLAAVQLLPFLELLGLSHRQAGWAEAAWSLPASGWANLVLPLFQCHSTGHGVYYQPNQYWTSSCYVGAAVIMLALCSLRTCSRQKLVLSGLVLFGLVMALGPAGKLYPALTAAIPQLSIMRFPVKYVTLAVFILPLLAAVGWTELAAARRGKAPVALGLGILLIVAGLLAYGLAKPAFLEARGDFLRDSLLHLILLIAMAALAGWIIRQTGATTKLRLWGGILLLALGLDLLSQAPRMNPTVPAQTLAPGLLARGQLNPFPGPGAGRVLLERDLHDLLNNRMVPDKTQDVLGRRQACIANYHLLDGIANLHGFYSLYLPAQHTLWERLYFARSNAFPAPLADLAGVAFVPDSNEVLAWKHRPQALPLITAGQQPVYLPLTNHLAKISAGDFQPRQVVYLPPTAQPAITATAQTNVELLQVQFSAHRIEFETASEQAAMVVVAQAAYKNWRVYVDDVPSPWWPANHAFQAFQVPGGRHRVRMDYVDRAFQVGLALSLLAGAVVIAALVFTGRRKTDAYLGTTGSPPLASLG